MQFEQKKKKNEKQAWKCDLGKLWPGKWNFYSSPTPLVQFWTLSEIIRLCQPTDRVSLLISTSRICLVTGPTLLLYKPRYFHTLDLLFPRHSRCRLSEKPGYRDTMRFKHNRLSRKLKFSIIDDPHTTSTSYYSVSRLC